MNSYLTRTLTVAAVCLVSLASAAYAQITVDYSATADSILDPTGALAPSGDLVRLGFFAPGFDFTANQTFSSLNGAFTQVDTTTISAPGKFADEVILAPGDPALGKQLYIWVFNTSSTATATSWVILTNNSANWTVPTAAPDFITPDTSDLGVFVPQGAFGIGVFNGTEPSGTNMTDWKMTNFAAVPEPSTYALLGLGALGMMGLRRRLKG